MAPRAQDPAQRAEDLLRRAQAAIRNVDSYLEALEASQEAARLFREQGNSRRDATATGVVVEALFRKANESHAEFSVEAKQLAEQELARFQEAGDRWCEATLKCALAMVDLEAMDIASRQRAAELAKDAKATFIDLGDKAAEAEATVMAAKALIKICDRSGGSPKLAREAAKFAREGACMGQELGDQHMEAICLYLLFCAKIYGEVPYKEAIKYGKESVNLFRGLGVPWWEFTVLRAMAERAVNKAPSRDCIRFAEESYEIAQRLEAEQPKRGWVACALATLVSAQLVGEDGQETAVEVAKEGVELLKASSEPLSQAQGWGILAGALLINDEKDKALEAAEEALKIYNKMGNKTNQIRLHMEIARIYSAMGNHALSIDANYDAIAVAEEIGDVRMHARNLSEIVRRHIEEQEADQALEAGAKAIAQYRDCQDPEGEGVVLLNMGSAHMAKAQYTEAMASCQEAQEIFRSVESQERIAQSFHFMAEVYQKTRAYEQAVQMTSASREIYRKLGRRVDEAGMLWHIASANLQLAEPRPNVSQKDDARRQRRALMAALRACKDGRAIAKELPKELDSKRTYVIDFDLLLAQSYGLLGKYKEGMKASKEAIQLSVEMMDRSSECFGIAISAQVSLHCGKEDEAKALAKQSYDLADKLQDQPLMQFAAALLQRTEPQADAGRGAAAAPAADLAAPAAVTPDAAASAAGPLRPYDGPSAESLIPKINELALSLIASDDVHQDTPLMDSGLDSLSMVQFRNMLQRDFPGVPMPASLIFDHPTVRALADNIEDELRDAHNKGKPLR